MSDEFSIAKDNPGGAPSKYKPEYCQWLIDHMSKGLSLECFAAKIDVDPHTISNWIKTNAEFNAAAKIGAAKSQLWWEEQGIEGLYSTTEYSEVTGKPTGSKSMNATVWKFNMENRFKWSSQQKVEHSNPDGKLQPLVTITLPSNNREVSGATEKKDGES